MRAGDQVFKCNRTFIGCKEQGQITVKEGQVVYRHLSVDVEMFWCVSIFTAQYKTQEAECYTANIQIKLNMCVDLMWSYCSIRCPKYTCRSLFHCIFKQKTIKNKLCRIKLFVFNQGSSTVTPYFLFCLEMYVTSRYISLKVINTHFFSWWIFHFSSTSSRLFYFLFLSEGSCRVFIHHW